MSKTSEATGKKRKVRNDFRMSWVLIVVIWAIFWRLPPFWPIGIYMVYRKLRGQRSTGAFRVLALVCGLLSCAWGVQEIVYAVRGFFPFSGFEFVNFYTAYRGLTALLLGLLLLLARRVVMDRDKRYDKYKAVIGSRYYMALGDIAAAMNLPIKRVRRDLTRMIDLGHFDDTSFIDEQDDYFLRSSYAYTILKKERPGKAEAEKAEEAEEETETDEFQKILRDIRRANDRIVDGEISDQIARIEAVTAQIFKSVSDSPEKMPQIRTFLNYYLPTTLKLMNAYSDLERKGVSGENITAAKENIRDIMGRLVTGFERQLDELYKDDVLDISSDIQVLEHMMQKDGFMRSDSNINDMVPEAEQNAEPEADSAAPAEPAGAEEEGE